MKIKKQIKNSLHAVIGKVAPEKFKAYHELRFWKGAAKKENQNLSNSHYESVYTDFFSLAPEWYKSKKILDIGCGPRGSLEWADMSAERVGLDPLVPDYLKLGADKHKMSYSAAPSENIPFEDEHFDVVCTFNSLDHVANYNETVKEIKRVVKKGGTLLVIAEVNHKPTPTEPISLPWNFLEDFMDLFKLIGSIRKYEIGDHRIYNQLRENCLYNENDLSERPGIVVARLERSDG